MSSEREDMLAKVLWDYLRLDHKLKNVGCMLVMGSYDARVPEYVATIHRIARCIVFSGKDGNQTRSKLLTSEAEWFAQIARDKGLPKDKKVFIEDQATNTGQNVTRTKELLDQHGIYPRSFLLVHKPHMERRAMATFRKMWPGKHCIVTSPRISFEEYPTQEIGKEALINIIVGDFQRVVIYPEMGFQVFQPIPERAWKAYRELKNLGYVRNLIGLNEVAWEDRKGHQDFLAADYPKG
jgi:uncharacterized SAM-binding protein YcdF (DUF218 family)